ncbi:MAG: type II toxin-antitoxin system VapC family toxin [Xenococcaceae cyanobacterium]
MENKRFTPLAIDINHALAVEELPLHHQDPFDRILIAQAMYEQLTIVTRDRKFNIYNVAILSA